MMEDVRVQYIEDKQERMRGYTRELQQLHRAAEQRTSPEGVAHIEQLQNSSDKLRVAYSELERIERANDEQWADAKRNFERVETELEQALRESAARIAGV